MIAWATSLIDTNAPNYAFAKQNDFLLSKGEPVKWWHGEGVRRFEILLICLFVIVFTGFS